MLVWLVAEEGTFIDETNVDKVPAVGEEIVVGRTYRVVDLPPADDNATRLGATVLVVKPAD